MNERIEQYFDAALTEAERKRLEADWATDPDLADDTAFYLQVRLAAQQIAHETLLKKKHEQWTNLTLNSSKPFMPKRWLGIAAAVLLLFFSVWYFNQSFQDDLSGRAKDYVGHQLKELPLHLGEEEQLLQQAIASYNQQQYHEAIRLTQSYLARYPQDVEAWKVIGLAQLQGGAYTEALYQFHRLGDQTQLYNNPGKYYEALTYLLRNAPGDEEKAKKLLQEVVDKNLEGKQDALKLLK